MKNRIRKVLLFVLLIIVYNESHAFRSPEYYEIRTYYYASREQESVLDNYLQNALLPALQRMKIIKIGVFKPIANDTAAVKKIIVLIAFKKVKQFLNMDESLGKDRQYQASGTDYINSLYTKPPYSRIETVLLKAFSGMPVSKKPQLKASAGDKVYELRSYESATEKIYLNKVDMFNAGGEVVLFEGLGFNAVFYGMVMAGSKMPNLMYMTSFENMDDRNAHWKTFSAHPDWKVLSAKPEYKNNVSRIDIILMRTTDYSRL
jgi:hypothetical protein